MKSQIIISITLTCLFAFSALAENSERYEVILTKHITLHQKYPTSGKLYGLEGDVIIRVQIDSSGHITSHSLVHEAQHSIFNDAISTMIKKASPVPTPPKSYFQKGETLVEFMLPIAFRKQENSTNLEKIDQIFQKKSREAWQ